MKIGLNNEVMQRANRNLILNILLECDGISRADLAKRTMLQRATITNIINQFLETGIVKEGAGAGEGGKSGLLYIDAPHAVVLSARITRAFFDVQAFSITGSILEHRHIAINKDSAIETTVQKIFGEMDGIVATFGEQNVIGLCFGLPGPYIRNHHNVAIVTGFEEIGKVDLQHELEARYHFMVITHHDAKLSAYAEWERLDPETQAQEDCLIAIQSIGIGIGSGIVIKGRILNGAVGVSGEIGHMGINLVGEKSEGGNRGVFESYASTAMAKKYVLERLYEFPNSRLNENSSLQDIKQAAADGDELALTTLDKLAWMLSYGLVNLIFVLNPNRIVLSEEYPNSERFFGVIERAMREMLYPELRHSVQICYSTIEMDSTILGGYYLVIKDLLKRNELLETVTAIEKQTL